MRSSGFGARLWPVTPPLEFNATLWRPAGRGTQTLITVPFDVRDLFGRARCPVRVTVNGYTWRTTTQVYDGGFHVVVNSEVCEACSADEGDTVPVHITRDDAIRTVDLPVELVSALRASTEARAAFESLAPAHQREYARWVGAAKGPDTRMRRCAAAVERLRKGALRPQSA
jgi:hypothetical protein